MDAVIDLRTRLIYASLQDDDLVRQLAEAREAAAERDRSTTTASRSIGTVAGRRRATGTRPWVASHEADDLMDADVTSSGAQADVVDVRNQQPPAVAVDLDAPSLSAFVVKRPSEWAGDDSSYYLG
jgi:hypothetical protein